MSSTIESQTRPPPPPPPPRANPTHGSVFDRDSHPLPNKTASVGNLSSAALLIRTIDSACVEMSSSALTAARDVEEARKNARVASEVVRRFASGLPLNSTIGLSADIFDSISIVPTSPLHPAPPPPPPPGASSLKTPQPRFVEEASRSNGASNGKRKMKSPTSAERLARAHAEDVLSLSLELERTKQALESEQMSHDETRSALVQTKARNEQLEGQMEKLLSDLETEREKYGRQVDALEHDLARAKTRAQAAEEDAQLALDLARGNAESREQLEGWLQRALQEIEVLRGHLLNMETRQPGTAAPLEMTTLVSESDPSPSRTVRFAEKPTILNEQPGRPPRALVAAGRSLLQGARAREAATSNAESSYIVARPVRSSGDRRRRLRERLQYLSVGESASVASLPSAPSTDPRPSRSSPPRRDLGAAVEALDVCRNACNILKASGRRLQLAGRWWNPESKSNLDDIHLETLARHYCTSVETLIERKQKDVIELESLCAMWENDSKV